MNPSRPTLGDAPVEERYRYSMNVLAQTVDSFLNGDDKGRIVPPRQVGFILMVFPFEGHEGRCNSISNADRRDVVILLKEQLARFEGQPEIVGKA